MALDSKLQWHAFRHVEIHEFAAIIALMMTFLLWLLLFVLCWPLALLALILYPLVWLILLPFRLLGFAVSGVLELVRSIILLPARLLRGRQTA